MFKYRSYLLAVLLLMFSLVCYTQAQEDGVPGASPGSGGALVPLTSEDHLLRAGDRLVFHIASLPEMDSIYVVRVDGFFFHPLVGEVKASGRTLGDLRAELNSSLAKELKNPSFRLGLAEVAKHSVAVLGEAQNQGTFEVGIGSTVLDLIAQAGGLSEKADRDTAVLLRGQERMEVSLRPDVGGGLTQVKSGDVLYVLAGSPVSVTGEVTAPGVYAVSRVNGDPRQALLAAGGAKEEASLTRVRLVRATLSEPLVLDLSADPKTPLPEEAQQLQDGDILVVPARQIVVLGAVSKPGPVAIRGGETLIDVLSEKLAKESNLKRILVVRSDDVLATRDKKEEYNLQEYFEKGKAEAAVGIYDGDLIYVPAKGKGIFESINLVNLIGWARWFL